MTATVTQRVAGVVVNRRRRTRHVVLSDGQEIYLTVEMAAALVAALEADGEVYLHRRKAQGEEASR